MKRSLAILCGGAAFLAGSSAWAAPPNSVTIVDLSGAEQRGRIVTVSRLFAKGEIAHCGQALVDGTPLPTQCDAKTRWRDASNTIAITGATNTNPVVITAPGHGFIDGDQVTIQGVQGNLAANGTWTVRFTTANTFALIGAAGSGSYGSGGSATGPAYGSLKHALLSFAVPTISARGALTVAWRDQADCNNAGYLDKAGMLAFSESAPGAANGWNAQMVFTPSGQGAATASTVDARAMLAALPLSTDASSALQARYWMRGPLVTQVIVEDRSAARLYDLGWACTANCATNYQNASWRNDPANRSIHPYFVLTFYTGASSVKVDFIGENVWSTARQDQRYTLALRTGRETLSDVYTRTLTHYAMTRWMNGVHEGRLESYWTAGAPGRVKIDYGLPYLIYSKAIPNYDQQKSVTQAQCCDEANSSSDYSLWVNSDRGDIGQAGTCDVSGTTVTVRSGLTLGRSMNSRSVPIVINGVVARLNHYIDATKFSVDTAPGDVTGAACEVGGHGFSYLTYFPQGGQVPAQHIGVMPTWATRLLFTMSNPSVGAEEFDVLAGQSAVGGYIPIHVRESDAGRTYYRDANGDGAADSDSPFGRPLSVDTRPTLRITDNSGSDALPVLASLSNAHGWTPDMAHQPAFAYLQYLLTGDVYWLEEMGFWASYNLAMVTPDTGIITTRNLTWGYLNAVQQLRAQAWHLRTAGEFIAMAPDDSPEKSYHLQKLNNTLAIQEGKFGITNGHFYQPPTTSPFDARTEQSRWAWGRYYILPVEPQLMAGLRSTPVYPPTNPTTMGFLNYGEVGMTLTMGISTTSYDQAPKHVTAGTNANPAVLTVPDHGHATGSQDCILRGFTGGWTTINGGIYAATVLDSSHIQLPVNSTSFGVLTPVTDGLYSGVFCGAGIQPWEASFMEVALGHLAELGFLTRPQVEYGSHFWTGMIRGANGYLLGSYAIATSDGRYQYYPDWATVKAGINSPDRTNWPQEATGGRPAAGSYSQINYAATSFAYPYTDAFGNHGSDAWSWMVDHIGDSSSDGDPKWQIVPRSAVAHQSRGGTDTRGKTKR